jgi:hypothetical protein
MKPPQLEILLFTDTEFSSRQYQDKSDKGNQSYEKRRSLEEACWNGLLHETMPELYWAMQKKHLVLWKTTQADHFLELEYGIFTEQKESLSSINPYLFIGSRSLS